MESPGARRVPAARSKEDPGRSDRDAGATVPRRRKRLPELRGGLRRFAAARDAVRMLVEEHGCRMLKLATEDEALTHDEVRARFEVFAPVLRVELKIGGPGARGDLVLCHELGIEHVIAPMIESAYGLTDYLAGLKEVFPDGGVVPAVNIETRGASERVVAILDADRERRIRQVTVGRSDLSKSMGLEPDDPAVMRLARRVILAARSRGLVTSVGGGLTPANVGEIARFLAPDQVNTRNFAFGDVARRDGTELMAAIRAALHAEIVLCEAAGTERGRARAVQLRDRMRREERDGTDDEGRRDAIRRRSAKC